MPLAAAILVSSGPRMRPHAPPVHRAPRGRRVGLGGAKGGLAAARTKKTQPRMYTNWFMLPGEVRLGTVHTSTHARTATRASTHTQTWTCSSTCAYARTDLRALCCYLSQSATPGVLATPDDVTKAGGVFLTRAGDPERGELIDAGDGTLATLPLEEGAPATAAGAVALFDDTSRGEHLYFSPVAAGGSGSVRTSALWIDGQELTQTTEARAGMRLEVAGKTFLLERQIFAHA